MRTNTPPESRRVSFNREAIVSPFHRLALGEAQGRGDNRRVRHDSATTVGGPPTPAPSSVEMTSAQGSDQSAAVDEPVNGPAQHLAQMPPTQMVAVLRDTLRSLAKNRDHIAVRLLLADLGRDMEAQVPDDTSLDLSYIALSDAIMCAEGRHGPHEGDYRRPNAFMRLMAKCCGRQA